MTAAAIRIAAHDCVQDVAALAQLRFDWRHTERGERGDLLAFGPAFGTWWTAHAATHIAWLAEVGGTPVGMAWLAIVSRVPGPEHFDRLAGVVQSVYVRPEHRGAGTGAALVASIVEYAHDHGLGYVGVHPSERSYPLYERAGFAETRAVLELGITGPRRPGE